MSQLIEPTPVRFFCSCLWAPEISIQEILSEKFEVKESLKPKENPLKNYYSKEMGENLHREIFIGKEIGPREKLVELKLWAQAVELKNSNNNRRLVNIDVGYIAKEQVILATGKPYSHRIYLNQGVHAELVYTFEAKTFKSLPWTYPDYQAEEKIQFFNQNRP